MNHGYPVRVHGRPDDQLSRGLWLVKWLLLIPHSIVLVFLWVAFLALTVVAFFAILLTGRYPRSIFEFNVGVLRWSWRVWFYGYYALGTDRYPPFTLHEVAGYPAQLEIDYPTGLSRGAVLVKTWLLAVPHYLVLAFLAGGGLTVVLGTDDDRRWTWGGGLIVLLTLFAAVTLLFTGRYPRPIFDLVLGMDRWMIRVIAYAALMTDEYPPFRLDQGGDDPVAVPVAAGSAATVAPPLPAQRGWTFLPIVGVAAGSLLVVAGVLAGAVGGLLLAVDSGLRDPDGYLMSGRQELGSAGYAVSSEDLEIQVDEGTGDLPRRLLGKVKIVAESEAGRPLFVGIARAEAVETYLAGVEHAVITDLDGPGDRLEPQYRYVAGDAPAMVPGVAELWSVSASGPDPELVWEPESGAWAVVVMNADGSAAVEAEVRAGATVPLLARGAGAILGVAVSVLALGVLLLVLSVHRAHRRSAPVTAGPVEKER